KARIIQIINFAQQGNFAAIDSVELHTLPKWKIAFLYSDNRLLPIFDTKVLHSIAENYEIPDNADLPVSSLMLSILEKKPAGMDIFSFAFQLYDEFGKNAVGHYVIGSKYRDPQEKYIDVFPKMYEKNVVAVGFAEDHDLEEL